MSQGHQKKLDSGFDRAVKALRTQGGVLRTVEILKAGIHPRTLYAMRQAGIVRQLGRGLYRLAEHSEFSNPDLILVAKKVPKGIICLLSALSFHNLTTQIPHEIYLALRRGSEYPRVEYPPVRIFQMAEAAFCAGVETHAIDGASVRIYGPEKTIADCFKFRNRIGLDTAVEALRFYRERRKAKVSELLRYASVCRVTKVMQPYLEAIL
jgi:predicted transcriptional regulator of viral defense system